MKAKLGMRNNPVRKGVMGSLVAWLWLAGGCGATQGSTESETHFLASCQDECGAGLECICGICTKPCNSVDPCRALADAASCETNSAGACADEPVSVCDVTCANDAECDGLGSGYTCDAGACRVRSELSGNDVENSEGTGSTTGGDSTLIPRGNLLFEISGCTTYSGGIGVDPELSSDGARWAQLPAIDGTQPGRRLADGEEGASVACSIDGGMPHQIEGRISGTQSHPSAQFQETVGIVIEAGWINALESGGTGEAAITLHTGGVYYRSPAETVCTLSLESAAEENQFSVGTGSIYARFDCPELEDPPTTGCSASGAFVFERCDEGG